MWASALCGNFTGRAAAEGGMWRRGARAVRLIPSDPDSGCNTLRRRSVPGSWVPRWVAVTPKRAEAVSSGMVEDHASLARCWNPD